MVLDRVRAAASTVGGALAAVRRSGVLHPVRPDRALRMIFPLVRFGTTPATAGALAALRFPDRLALIDELGELTHAELEHNAAALATALRARVTPEERIGILCRNHRGFVESLLAAPRLGNDVVLLNTDFSGPQLTAVLKREGIGAVIFDEEFGPLVDAASFGGVRLVAWHDTAATALKDETLDELIAATEPEPMVAERGSELVILTSGTTGTPKGARHDITVGALMPAALTHGIRVPLRSGDPIVIGPPVFHTLGLAYLLAGLGLGMPVVLRRRFDAAQTLKDIDMHRAGAFIAVPVMAQRLLDAAEADLTADTSSLSVVVCAGAALHGSLSEAFMDEFGDVLVNVYGATETGWATIATPADLRAAPGTVGRPSLGLTVKLLDAGGHEVPQGTTGEIFVGGGMKFSGYTGGGGKQVRDGLTSTGDLGHLDEAGRLFIDGRADDMIISGGENVFPGEVEDLLQQHPDVADVAVVGVPDETFGQRLAAYVVPRDDKGDEALTGEALAEELKAHVRSQLARYKVPRDIVFVTDLPRTSTGKVKSRQLGH